MNVAVCPEHLNILSICTGGAGLDLGVELAIPSARSMCMVEREAFAVAQLVSAMEAGLMAPAPIWSDARTFNGRAWRGAVDGLIGGIPCQPHSVAGRKKGQHDERDLWSDARRIIVQSRSWFALIENVGGMLSAGDDEIAGAQRVFRDLSKLGFTVEGGLFTASEVGAPHVRERIFILAVADAGHSGFQRGEFFPTSRSRNGKEASGPVAELRRAPLADASGSGHDRRPDGKIGRPLKRIAFEGTSSGVEQSVGDPDRIRKFQSNNEDGAITWQDARCGLGWTSSRLFPPGPADGDGWREELGRSPHLEPSVRRMADGMASHVDELRMLGNGVVCLEAAYALRTLGTRLAARGSAGAARLVRLMEGIAA